MHRPTLALAILASPAAADEAAYRLIVADAEAPRLTVLDPAGEGASESFDLTSPGRLHADPDGRHAWVVQRAAGVVQLFDTGLVEEDHGDHSALVLEAPALLPTAIAGVEPVHFNHDDTRIAIFWDGSGNATLHEAAAVAAGDTAPVASFETGGPHHGVAVPVGETTIVSVAPEGEGLPDALALHAADGAEIARIDCTDLHGEGSAAGFIAFGCADGVALFDTSATPPAARFVPYPEDAPEGGMVRTLLSPAATRALVANFGPDHLAIFDPAAETGDFVFAALPAPRVAFALDETGEIGFAALADGRVVRFSALTGAILGEAASVTGAYSMDSGVTRPMMAVAGDRVAVSDPAAGAVTLLDAATLDVVTKIETGGTPQALLLLAAEADHAH